MAIDNNNECKFIIINIMNIPALTIRSSKSLHKLKEKWNPLTCSDYISKSETYSNTSEQ